MHDAHSRAIHQDNSTGARPRVLIIEDSISLAATYQNFLKNEPLEVVQTHTGKDALASIGEHVPDLALLDLRLPDIPGMDILKYLHTQCDDVVVIVITGHGSANIAADALKLGAYDFISKPVSGDRLRTTIRNSLNYCQLQHVVEGIEQYFEREQFEGFLGKSLVMQAVYRMIETSAPSKASVFITGESGSGKEVCAHAVHQRSPRAAANFIAINCAAIPHDLIESELFGHVKGAFSGAVSNRRGAILRADGGTLFLDEICEMNLDIQGKLLRFLQTQQITPVGSDQVIPVDVRVIAATNRDPYVDVQEKKFREDLFYRLHVIPIHIPPLRERGDDVLMLAKHMLEQFSQEEGKHFVRFESEVERFMRNYSWPGNVRHLQNVIRSIVVLYDEKTVTKEMLPEALGHEEEAIKEEPVVCPVLPLEVVEQRAIQQAIDYCDGNISNAASLLQVSPSTIYRKIQSWKENAEN